MPKFENLDPYEVPSKSGKTRITPIAPHSTSGFDYSPVKRQSTRHTKQPDPLRTRHIEVEPIDIGKMEKEFKIADRKAKRRQGSIWKRWRKSLRKLLKRWGLIKPTQAGKEPSKGNRSSTSGPKSKPKGKSKPTPKQEGEKQPGKGSGKNQRNRNRRRRPNRNRSRNPESRNSGNQNGDGKPEGPKDSSGSKNQQGDPNRRQNQKSRNRKKGPSPSRGKGNPSSGKRPSGGPSGSDRNSKPNE